MSDDPIRFTARMKGGSDVARLLNRYPDKVRRTLDSLVKQEARGLAVELARNTRPFGFSEKAKKRGEKAVAGDINRVFALPVRRLRENQTRGSGRRRPVLGEHPESPVLAGASRPSSRPVSNWAALSVGSPRSEAPPGKPHRTACERHPQEAGTDRHQRKGARHLHRPRPEAGRLRQGRVDQRGQGHRRTGAWCRAMGDPAQEGTRHRHREDRRQASRHPHQQARLHRPGQHPHRDQTRA